MHRLPTGGNVKNAFKSFQKPHFRYGQCTLDIKLRKLKKDETPRTAEALESVCQQPLWVELLSKFTLAVCVSCSGNHLKALQLQLCEQCVARRFRVVLSVQQLEVERKWVVSMKPNPPRSSSTFAAWQYISTPQLGNLSFAGSLHKLSKSNISK